MARKVALGQSKIESFIEVSVNILIGLTISFIANLIVLPLFGYDVTVLDGFLISIVFTVVSLVRSYLVRRFFNDKLERKIYKSSQARL